MNIIKNLSRKSFLHMNSHYSNKFLYLNNNKNTFEKTSFLMKNIKNFSVDSDIKLKDFKYDLGLTQTKDIVMNEVINNELKKVKNINQLFNYLDSKDEFFFKNENTFLSIINKFRSFEDIEINSNFKIYIFLDYILLKDAIYSKEQMRYLFSLMIKNSVKEDIYWEHIYHKLELMNFFEDLEQNKNVENIDFFMEVMKIFSVINYSKKTLWKKLEKLSLLIYKHLSISDLEALIICFISKKKGSHEFMEELIEYSKLKSDKEDILVNFTISIIKNFRKKFDIYHKFIDYSLDHLIQALLPMQNQKKIFDNVDLVFVLLPHFYNIFYKQKIYRKTDRYDKRRLKEFIYVLENIFSSHMTLQVKIHKDKAIECLAKVVEIQRELNFKFKHIKKHLLINYFISNWICTETSNMNPNLYIKVLLYFKIREVKLNILNKLFTDNFWEHIINNIHLIETDNLIELLGIIKHYNVKYTRLLIFIQNNLKNKLSVAYETIIDNNNITNRIADDKKTLIIKRSHLETLEIILFDGKFYFNQDILVNFYLFISSEIKKINTILSW